MIVVAPRVRRREPAETRPAVGSPRDRRPAGTTEREVAMRRLIHPIRWHRERRWRRAAAQWHAAQARQRGQQPIRRSLAQINTARRAGA